MDFSKIKELEFDGINHKDYPDYCDAYVIFGLYKGRPLTDEELDIVNDNGEFVHEMLIEQLW
jgi:hypothetical protein